MYDIMIFGKYMKEKGSKTAFPSKPKKQVLMSFPAESYMYKDSSE